MMFDDTLRTVLITILNVDINNDQWLQASLSVGDGGLGIQSAEMLARYDTRCYFNVRSKADISQLNLPHGTDN